MMRVLLIATALAGLCGWAVPAWAQSNAITGISVKLDARVAFANKEAVSVSLPPNALGHAFRLRVKSLAPPAAGDWKAVVTWQGGSAEYQADGFVASGGTILTRQFEAGTKDLSVRVDGAGPPLRADAAVILVAPSTPLSVVDIATGSLGPKVPNYVAIGELVGQYSDTAAKARIAAASKAMVKLQFQDLDSGLINECSGFLVSRRLVMTNYHCHEKHDTSRVVVRGWLHGRTPDFRVEAPTYQGLKPLDLELQSRAGLSRFVDVALLRLPVEETAVTPLKLVTKLPAGLKKLLVLQYPLSRPLSGVIDTDCVSDGPVRHYGRMDRDALKHGCDTDNGSSGSPVLDRNGALGVVALHFWGHDNREKRKNRAELMPNVVLSLKSESDPLVKSMIKYQEDQQ